MGPEDEFQQEQWDRMEAWAGPQGSMADADFRARLVEFSQLDEDMRANQMLDLGGWEPVTYGGAPSTSDRQVGHATPQYEPPTPEELERRRLRSKEYAREQAEREAREAEQERLDRLNARPDERLMRAAAQPRQQSITGTGVSGFTTLILWGLGICAAVALLTLVL